ncbi:MAG: 6,7-dimethyl-8-ribityllumazine synthase [Hymenobacteraceae bacterium]|nr:6,7-dimethyl-8-ribityllumazine synthase [Hymenobacteraceae bacterium]
MASALHNLSAYDAASLPDVHDRRFGLVVADWHADLTSALAQGAVDTLQQHGLRLECLTVLRVPGSFELTFGAQRLAQHPEIDAVICLGVVIRGDTKHDDYINHAVAQGLTAVSLKFDKPVVFGLVTTNDLQQAVDRCGGQHGNKGVEAAVTAIRLLSL